MDSAASRLITVMILVPVFWGRHITMMLHKLPQSLTYFVIIGQVRFLNLVLIKVHVKLFTIFGYFWHLSSRWLEPKLMDISIILYLVNFAILIASSHIICLFLHKNGGGLYMNLKFISNIYLHNSNNSGSSIMLTIQQVPICGPFYFNWHKASCEVLPSFHVRHLSTITKDGLLWNC